MESEACYGSHAHQLRLCVWRPAMPFSTAQGRVAQTLPRGVEHMRRKQLMILGRYARQPIDVWEGRDVGEITEWVDVLMEVLRDENPLASRGENA